MEEEQREVQRLKLVLEVRAQEFLEMESRLRQQFNAPLVLLHKLQRGDLVPAVQLSVERKVDRLSFLVFFAFLFFPRTALAPYQLPDPTHTPNPRLLLYLV